MTKEEEQTTRQTMEELQQTVGYFQAQLLVILNEVSTTLKDLKNLLEK